MPNDPWRPTKYKKEYNKKVYQLCLLGATDEEIASFLDVDVATVNRWKIEYSSFCESIKAGKEAADMKVAKSLYKKARGFTHAEKTIENGEVTKIVIKETAPDTQAASLWLRNRQPKKWRDKIENEITVKKEGPLSQEELEALIAANEELKKKIFETAENPEE